MAKMIFVKIFISRYLKIIIRGIHGIPTTSICIHNSIKLVLHKLIYEKIGIFFKFKKTNLNVYEKIMNLVVLLLSTVGFTQNENINKLTTLRIKI